MIGEQSRATRARLRIKPGSDEAIEAGCECPIIANDFGGGDHDDISPIFWVNLDCPVHQDMTDTETGRGHNLRDILIITASAAMVLAALEWWPAHEHPCKQGFAPDFRAAASCDGEKP